MIEKYCIILANAMKHRIQFMVLLCIVLCIFHACNQDLTQVPVLSGEPVKICELPDLDSLNGPDLKRQHVVDHGFIRAGDGSWQLWACMRGTAVGRLLYGWQGKSLTEAGWLPHGVVARADASWDEVTVPEEKIQAPYFIRQDSAWLCFYNSNGFRVMRSDDGINYRRFHFRDGTNLVFDKAGRDVMIMEDEGLYYAYSTISTVSRDNWRSGFIVVRTSKNILDWSDYTIVSQGGIGGNGPVSAESPFVLKKGGMYYLFRSSSWTGKCYVYASDDPYNFGVNNDSKLITMLPVKAPELIQLDGQWYISDIADFTGIRIYRLEWILKR
ncbi:MAG: hypothetical protein AMS26_19660 [Bacteroides sp. SM23_62]|nr:MAG: hypothetical protein AMS26_19660 [Bacteroides sp. SM23_62]